MMTRTRNLIVPDTESTRAHMFVLLLNFAFSMLLDDLFLRCLVCVCYSYACVGMEIFSSQVTGPRSYCQDLLDTAGVYGLLNDSDMPVYKNE